MYKHAVNTLERELDDLKKALASMGRSVGTATKDLTLEFRDKLDQLDAGLALIRAEQDKIDEANNRIGVYEVWHLANRNGLDQFRDAITDKQISHEKRKPFENKG